MKHFKIFYTYKMIAPMFASQKTNSDYYAEQLADCMIVAKNEEDAKKKLLAKKYATFEIVSIASVEQLSS